MAMEMDGSSDSNNVDGERFFIAACQIDTMLMDTLFDGWV